MTQEHRYNRPFSGIPSPLPLSGLFLFSPSVDMKLAGKTIRGVFADEGKESLFKRMEQLQRQETPSAADTLREVLALFPDAPFNRIIEAAVNGDGAARAQVDMMGLWEVYLYDRWAVPGGKLTPLASFILEIKRACKEPLRLVQQKQFTEAASLLSTHPVMRQFLWPDVLSIFSSARENIDLLPIQISIALEIRLSMVALVDVTVSTDENAPVESRFSCIVPSHGGPNLNPTSLFFRWLKKEVGARSIDALLGKNASSNASINITTLKRWSNGSHQPNKVWLRVLANDLFGDADYEPLWKMYWASRHLNFIGHLAETLHERASGLIGIEQQCALAPWPKMPFECDSITSWFETRYPIWLSYHRSRLA